MNNKKIIMALAIAFASSTVLADNSTTEFQASSKITATCSMSAINMNVGLFLLPLSSQYFGGSISLLCSREASYTIDLAYGGVYGQGQTGDGSYWQYSYSPNSSQQIWNKFTKGGAFIDSVFVLASDGGALQIAADSLGCTFNAGGTRCLTARPSYDYGMMKGATKGDSVAYSIFVPGDSSKVWNAGKNSYSGTGTGKQEQVTFQGRIIPAQSGSAYPAPDFYTDTITASIKY